MPTIELPIQFRFEPFLIPLCSSISKFSKWTWPEKTLSTPLWENKLTKYSLISGWIDLSFSTAAYSSSGNSMYKAFQRDSKFMNHRWHFWKLVIYVRSATESIARTVSPSIVYEFHSMKPFTVCMKTVFGVSLGSVRKSISSHSFWTWRITWASKFSNL